MFTFQISDRLSICAAFRLSTSHNSLRAHDLNQLDSEWVPRALNQISDAISKDIDKDDFMLNPDTFAVADTCIIWGPHRIDRISFFKTRQVPHFYSRWLSPFMEYLDAFSTSWQGENNWLFPPPSIVSRVIKHLIFSKADATLVIPFWPSAPW